jgi:hypothetical protein
VFHTGDLIGVYYGRTVSDRADGDYVLSVQQGTFKVSIDAESWGSIMRFANQGAPPTFPANAKFAAVHHASGMDVHHRYPWLGHVVPVVATGTIYEHDEVLLHYGPEYKVSWQTQTKNFTK